MMRSSASPLLAFALLFAPAGDSVFAQAPGADVPRLVTFGSRAPQSEGDHDFQQVIRISVPETAGQLHFRIFDPDVGGAHDEAMRGFNTRTRFSLYGAGAAVRLYRDADDVNQEDIEGEPLQSAEFAFDEAVDGRWETLFTADAASGAVDGARRRFFIVVEGLSGDDGNVFDVAVSRSATDNLPVQDARLTSFITTLQVAEDGEYAELRLMIPETAGSLVIENFDAAGGSIAYAGRFHSVPLTASGKSKWQRDHVELWDGEAGRLGSVIASGGNESPNDVTIAASVPSADGSGPDTPIAMQLPVRTVPPNQRPYILFSVDQTVCGEMVFDATGSFDGDDDALTHRWRFDGDDTQYGGAKLIHRFARAGDHRGRIESFDSSGVVANGRTVDFSFFVKPPPVAEFTAPDLVALGTEARFDATASRTGPRPAGNRITRYHWRMGDGAEIIQNEGDADFGLLAYRYADHGTYEIELTVTDSLGIACNMATASGTITVNAPPVARAGGDRDLLTGEIGVFDAGASDDPDGKIASYWWDFGDGKRVFGPKTRHTFHRPGTYQVRLTVIDDTVYETAADTDIVTVTVRDPANARPTAKAGEDRVAAIGETLTFDGSASTDSDGRILFYLWDFGDGTGDDAPVVRHTYWQPGIYTVHLTVKDDNADDGGQSVDTVTIEVVPADNRAPVLEFPQEFVTTLHVPVRFDASKANDRDGAIVSYDWDFGDGATGTGAAIEHRYEETGTYSARLVLTDNGIPEPQKTVIAFDVIVTGKANTAPSPQILAEGAGTVGAPVAFDGSASSDSDGSIMAYAWDFGDGHRATGIEIHHVYQFPGRYEVTLTVTDDDVSEQRLSALVTHVIDVKAPENSAPTAAAGADMTVARGEIVRFDGTASADADGNIMVYDWDFGDGGRSPDARPVHAFHDAGTYTVELTVTDDGTPALSDKANIVVTVVEEGDERASK